MYRYSKEISIKNPFSLIDEISIVESKSKIFVSFFVTQPMSSLRISLRVHTSIFLFETNANRVSYDLVAKQENLFCFFFCCRFLLEHRGNGLLTRATDISKSHVEVLFEEKGFSRESILRYFWTFIRPFEKTQENFLEKRFLKPFFIWHRPVFSFLNISGTWR